jgi:hypothetical protein
MNKTSLNGVRFDAKKLEAVIRLRLENGQQARIVTDIFEYMSVFSIKAILEIALALASNPRYSDLALAPLIKAAVDHAATQEAAVQKYQQSSSSKMNDFDSYSAKVTSMTASRGGEVAESGVGSK